MRKTAHVPGQHIRLALSGQLGPEAMASDDMADTMKLCVSCKGCKRECPTGGYGPDES